ncbi:hypothetical protein JHK85_026794 [Glycine max]|nr:hypothetical protein JHK85_026794 [Glycine max]
MDKDGGPIAKELIPKLTVVRRNLSSKLGVAILDINKLDNRGYSYRSNCNRAKPKYHHTRAKFITPMKSH